MLSPLLPTLDATRDVTFITYKRKPLIPQGLRRAWAESTLCDLVLDTGGDRVSEQKHDRSVSGMGRVASLVLMLHVISYLETNSPAGHSLFNNT